MAIWVGSVRVLEMSEFEIGTTRICSHARNSDDKIMKILGEGLLIGAYLPTKFHAVPLTGCWVTGKCTYLSLKLAKLRTVKLLTNCLVNLCVSMDHCHLIYRLVSHTYTHLKLNMTYAWEMEWLIHLYDHHYMYLQYQRDSWNPGCVTAADKASPRYRGCARVCASSPASVQ